MKATKTLSKKQINDRLDLFKFLISQKSSNKINTLKYLDDNSINQISESIYNILFNEKDIDFDVEISVKHCNFVLITWL